MWNLFINPDSWISLIILILLEIILGIDNILFLILISRKLPYYQQKKARRIGLLVSMIFRLLFLFFTSWMLNFQKYLFCFNNNLFKGNISSQNIIFLFGGLFLIYKSSEEIYYKIANLSNKKKIFFQKKTPVFQEIILQIVLLDIIFSIDSFLTAIGIISLKQPPEGFGQKGLIIIALSIIITISLMFFFSESINIFIYKYPSIQMLGLCFLILVGIMLILESFQIGKWVINGYTIKNIPKTYLYFTICFSIVVEFFNLIKKK